MLRVGLIADFREENWPSMDLVAEMLLRHLPAVPSPVTCARIEPPFRARIGRLLPARGAHIGDRILNRFFDYPRWLRAHAADFDLYHVVDHSYAHLATELPPGRTIVTCHDIDAFRPLLEPGSRSLLPTPLVRRVLAGLRAARHVICVSEATRADLVAHRLVEPARATVVHNGVHPACSPRLNEIADGEAERLLGPPGRSVDLLHVGSTIPRKRLDVAIATAAAVRARCSEVRLVRVGGPLTGEQRVQAERLGMTDRIVEMPFLSPEVLAAIYRRAAVVILPSEREGFGLPLVESLACGTPVVASGIPAFREVGGSAAIFCEVGDDRAWAETVVGLLLERRDEPGRWRDRQTRSAAHGQRFSWGRCAAQTADIYRAVPGKTDRISAVAEHATA